MYQEGRRTLGTWRSAPSSRTGTRGFGGAFAAIWGSHGGRAGTRRCGNAGAVGTWRGTRHSPPTGHGASAGVLLLPWPCRAAIARVWEGQGGTSTDHPNRTAVVRDPSARWGGRGEAVRPLPIPIRLQLVMN